MRKNIFLTLMLLTLLLTGCKNDSFYYQDEARIRVEGPYI